jgi:hypothetical protein
MKSIFKLFVTTLLGVAIVPMAFADSDEEMDEATITVVDEGSTPEDVVKVIELPDHASATAATKSASGQDTANNAKDKSGESGREFGQQVSADAHSNNMSDQVRADAAQQARGDARSDNAGGNRHGPPH